MHLMHWVRLPLFDGKVEETDLSQWRSSASMASLSSREGQHVRVRIYPDFRMVLVVCLEEVSKFGSCLRVFRSENTISHTH